MYVEKQDERVVLAACNLLRSKKFERRLSWDICSSAIKSRDRRSCRPRSQRCARSRYKIHPSVCARDR